MSTVNPLLKLCSYSDKNKRLSVLFPAFQNPAFWHVFYGFDRPRILIEQHTQLSNTWERFFSFKKLTLYRTVKSFIKGNDVLFEKDINETEIWIRSHISLLNSFIVLLPSITTLPWRCTTIELCVHAINYAFTYNNTIVIGIRPPEILHTNKRLVVLLHEFIHVNLGNFPYHLTLDETLIEPAGEVLALYYTLVALERHHDKISLAARNDAWQQWHAHNLKETDFKILSSALSERLNQTELKNALEHTSVSTVFKNYKPLDYENLNQSANHSITDPLPQANAR